MTSKKKNKEENGEGGEYESDMKQRKIGAGREGQETVDRA